jgi:hypothetical protein
MFVPITLILLQRVLRKFGFGYRAPVFWITKVMPPVGQN